MRMLVLGGTGLTGSAIVADAIERGHDVVAVHRGSSIGHPDAEHVVLDRADGHASLRGDWDAVIDVSGYVPAIVRDALAQLASPTTRWLFVSTTSVFADPGSAGNNEQSRVRECDDDVREQALTDPRFDWRGAHLYGECKVICEREVLSADVASATIVRPCVIAGAHDATWRFPYWVDRAGRGGRIVAPSPGDAPVAVIDVRDLATFALDCVEGSVSDTFVLAPNPVEATMERLVDASRSAWPDVESSIEWVDPDVLRAHEVEPWAGLPFWLPEWTEFQGFNDFDASKAYAAGFAPRPLEDTARAVRQWLESGDELPERGKTLTAEHEARIVAHLRGSTDGAD